MPNIKSNITCVYCGEDIELIHTEEQEPLYCPFCREPVSYFQDGCWEYEEDAE